MKTTVGMQLIEELLSNPKSFNKAGKSYDLLQEYFEGFPLETLIPLLKSDDKSIQEPAIWIVSELGKKGCSLLPYVIPLVNSKERFTKYYALECIMVCSNGNNVKELIHVINGMNSNDEVIRIHAMYLISNADDTQLQKGLELLTSLPDQHAHSKGLSILRKIASLDSQEVYEMIDSDNPLIRKYGVIAAKKFYPKNRKLINYALTSSDSDVQQFSQDIINMNVD